MPTRSKKPAYPHAAINVRSVMTQKVATVTPKSTLRAVARLLSRKNISCVVVLKRGKVAGIISERDIVRHTAGSKADLARTTVDQVMSSPVESLSAGTPLEKAVLLMKEKGYRRFPILDENGSLAGIVTQTDVLRAFTRELEVANDRMKEMAIRDSLTGLFNRRYFIDHLQREFFRCRRYNSAMALIMADLDDFKQVNDRYGHQYGDHVLCEVAEIFHHAVRGTDTLARFGGEEFTVLALHQDLAQACALAERLRSAVASSGRTASFGVVTFPDPDARIPEDLIRRADLAMYHAKSQGKDRVASWSKDMEDFTGVRK